jgi:hypothetical protein
MPTSATINWAGQSGKAYVHWIYPLGTVFDPVAGNYVFAKEVTPNHWSPVYIGQTSDLSVRFDNHHALQCAKRNGATHVHVHRNDNEKQRLGEEMDLIHHWSPSCNIVGT